MNTIPDVVGYKLESALHILEKYNFDIIINETFGKESIDSKEARVLKQTIYNNKLKLIISYF